MYRIKLFSAIEFKRRILSATVFGVVSIFFLTAIGCFLLSTIAQADPTCQSAQTLQELRNLARNATEVRSFAGFPTAPAGGTFDLALDTTLPPTTIFKIVLERNGVSDLREDGDVTSEAVSENHWLVKAGLVRKGDVLLRIAMPDSTQFFWQASRLTIFACSPDKGSVVFRSDLNVSLSDARSFIFLSAFITSILYCFCGFWCKQKEDPLKLGERNKIPYWRYLDPVVLSSGPNGKGSISRLQILFFSVIVFFTLIYSFFRIGVLSDLSVTVLELLGISAVGAAAARAADVNQNRLDWDNWVWLIDRGWLPENGLEAITQAKWGDLVTGDDGFDVYHFQMFIFSIIVGFALLLVGFNDLATFKIPDAILGLLGLTQIVYLGGKLVAPPSCRDLDKAIAGLRKAETAYFTKLQTARGTPEDAATARQLADPEFTSMADQLEAVKTLFRSVMGKPQPDANLAVRLKPSDPVRAISANGSDRPC